VQLTKKSASILKAKVMRNRARNKRSGASFLTLIWLEDETLEKRLTFARRRVLCVCVSLSGRMRAHCYLWKVLFLMQTMLLSFSNS